MKEAAVGMLSSRRRRERLRASVRDWREAVARREGLGRVSWGEGVVALCVRRSWDVRGVLGGGVRAWRMLCTVRKQRLGHVVARERRTCHRLVMRTWRDRVGGARRLRALVKRGVEVGSLCVQGLWFRV